MSKANLKTNVALYHEAAMSICEIVDLARIQGNEDEFALQSCLEFAKSLEHLAAQVSTNNFDKAVLYRSAASIVLRRAVKESQERN